MNAKRIVLRQTQFSFRRACDQIILLNKRMEGVLYRYHAARARINRGFRYKLRLRLAIVEGIRNMYYEYANRKAFEIVNLRRDLFGEIVEIVSDESIGDRYFTADSESAEEIISSDLDVSLSDSDDETDLEEYSEDEAMDVDVA